jgi:molybdenum cofactor cytidylyltransferase
MSSYCIVHAAWHIIQPMLSVILLAAGKSQRMGKLKQLMPLGKSTIIEQAVDNLLSSAVNEVIVVVGHKAEEITKTIATKPVKIMLNPNYGEGMSTSIIAGLILVDPKAQAVMLALGDQPLVDSQTINRLIDEFHKSDKGIAVPTHKGRRGHPVIFAIKYKPELLELKGDIGGREIIKRHPQDVLEVAVDSEGVISDIDTEDDYPT